MLNVCKQTNNISSSVRDLLNDSDPLYLNGTSFMFGVGIVKSANASIFDDTYITLQMRFYKNFKGTQTKEMFRIYTFQTSLFYTS